MAEWADQQEGAPYRSSGRHMKQKTLPGQSLSDQADTNRLWKAEDGTLDVRHSISAHLSRFWRSRHLYTDCHRNNMPEGVLRRTFALHCHLRWAERAWRADAPAKNARSSTHVLERSLSYRRNGIS